MLSSQKAHYHLVAAAIGYLHEHATRQPSLADVAAHVHLSPFHFQKLFTEWAGTSPKKFLQFISATHARTLLVQQQATLFDTALATGLSGTGRLHDLFVQIEGMTPAELKHGGAGLEIQYMNADTLFGKALIATTPRGICHLSFHDDIDVALSNLHFAFPAARLTQQANSVHEHALNVIDGNNTLDTIKLHLRGTPFQLKVWEALLKIPEGAVRTYGNIASAVGSPSASRAAGTAIGANPVAYLIPCHRVIQATGALSGYRWGTTRKAALMGWEMAHTDPNGGAVTP